MFNIFAEKLNKLKSIIVIGGGFSGMVSAAYLAKMGYTVTLIEKNSTLGGRCRTLIKKGYKFDIGPSWYWMPDVFEKFFNDFNYSAKDFYSLKLLDPAFEIIYQNNRSIKIPSSYEALLELFESIEKGSAQKLNELMKDAEIKYNISMNDIVYKPFVSFTEILDRKLLLNAFKLSIFQSMHKYVRKYFKDARLTRIMEFPVIFLGGMPKDIPALYSLMNYAAFKLGTWYPDGGMFEIVKGIEKLIKSLGVRIKLEEEVVNLKIKNNVITTVFTNKTKYSADAVVSAIDYHHFDTKILEKEYSNYSEEYWNKRFLAPSALLFFVGVKKRIAKLSHHTLFFDADFDTHSSEIYEHPQWPQNPLFYLSCTSKTDPSVATEGHENLVILVPVAAGLKSNPELNEYYFQNIISRIEAHTGENIQNAIDFKKVYSVENFIDDYHSFKGNAYGLANTLLQTAFLKPSMINKKVHNLVYAGQLTVPGPGVPPAIISGKIAANLIHQKISKH